MLTPWACTQSVPECARRAREALEPFSCANTTELPSRVKHAFGLPSVKCERAKKADSVAEDPGAPIFLEPA
jgi:hypothetical protein